MNIGFTLDVPEDDSAIVVVRQTARAFLEYRKAAAQDVDDVETLLGELCSNVTRHARSQVGHFLVRLEHHGDHIMLVVTDWGNGMERTGVPAVGTLRVDADGTDRFGGFGLLLVDSLTDRVEFSQSDPTGMTVRAQKNLKDTARADGR